MKPLYELFLVFGMWIVFLLFGWYGGFKGIMLFGWILLGITIAILIRNYYLSKK